MSYFCVTEVSLGKTEVLAGPYSFLEGLRGNPFRCPLQVLGAPTFLGYCPPSFISKASNVASFCVFLSLLQIPLPASRVVLFSIALVITVDQAT